MTFEPKTGAADPTTGAGAASSSRGTLEPGLDDESTEPAIPDEDAAGTGPELGRTAQEARQRAGRLPAGEPVDPEDPLLDTRIRRLTAGVSAEQPFGRPGAPLSRASPYRWGFSVTLGVVSALLLVQAAISVRQVLVLLLISLFLASGLNPAVMALVRRGLRRGAAVGVVFVLLALFFVGFGFAIVPPILEQGSQFLDKAPSYLQQLEANATIRSLNDQFGVIDKAQAYLSDGGFTSGAIGGLLGVGKVVLNTFFSGFTVLILTLYFLANLPGIKSFVYRLVPRSRRPRVGLLGDEVINRVGGYVAGALSIALIAGVASYVFLVIAGVPYPLALALVVALLDLVPLVGATVGAVVVTGVAFFVSVPVGIASAAFYLLYQQVENYLIYPRVMRRSVDVSPAATVVAVLVGGALLGVPGALLAIPITAAIQLILFEVVVPRQDHS